MVAAVLGAAGAWLYAQLRPAALVPRRFGLRLLHRPARAPVRDLGRGPPRGRPARDAPHRTRAFLGTGALLASFIGTTGASMLLIRPLLQTNRERKHVAHTVVFFIFLVSNIGGCLTPLGDPPLFLGYLAGVPFTWTLPAAARVARHRGAGARRLRRLGPPGVRARALGDRRADPYDVRPLRIAGKDNVVLLAGVLAAAALLQAPWRELAIVALAALSYLRTDRELHAANHFTFHPILEVAAALRRNLRDDAAGAGPAPGPRRGARRARALAVLLGERVALLVPRQRAHVPDVPGARPGSGPAARDRGRAPRDPARDQPGRGLHGRQHLHRQRAQLHGALDRRGAAACACRASAATCCTAERY